MELKTGFPPEEVYYRIYKQTRWPFWMTIVCLQWFDEWDYEKENFVRNVDNNTSEWEAMSADEQFHFIHDDFETMEGSCHSRKNCSLEIISEDYAAWFIKNECWNIYDRIMDRLEPDDEETNPWSLYEREIKELAEKDGIKYEGY